jgi:hypothetical protein
VQILATRSWGSPKVARFAPTKSGNGAIAALEYAPKLVVRRVDFSSSATPPTKEATLAPPNRTAKFETWAEDDQGNVFVLYKSTSGTVASTRLARIDAQSNVAFDIEFETRGCAALSPDGTGGVYTASYAPKLAQDNAFNAGRTRVARYGAQGALAWESVGAADVTYVAGACAIATSSTGVMGAFTLASDGNVLSPGSVRLIRLESGGAPLGQSDGLSWPASGATPAVASLLLFAKEAWSLPDGGVAVVGRDAQQQSWLVRYDKDGKATGGLQVREPLVPLAGGAFVTASTTEWNRYAPSGGSFVKSTASTSPVATEPSHTVKDVAWAGARWVGWGQRTNSNLPVLAFLSAEGARLGSFASSTGVPFDPTVFGVAASNSHFLLLQKDASDVVRLVVGTYALGGTAPQVEAVRPGTLPRLKPIVVR